MAIARHDDETGDEFTLETDLDELSNTPREGFGDEYDSTTNLPTNVLGEGGVASETGPSGTTISSDEAWKDLSDESYKYNPDTNSINWGGGERPGLTTVSQETKDWLVKSTEEDKKLINEKVEETKTALKDFEKPWYEKIARGVLNVATYGLGGKLLDAAGNLLKTDEGKLSDADKKIQQAQLEKQLLEYEGALEEADSLIENVNRKYPEKTEVLKDNIALEVKRFREESGRDPNPDEFKNIVIAKTVSADPEQEAVVRKKAQEGLIKSYNPNANLSQFGMVDPKMLGENSNPALEAGLEQLRQMEAKRAETQAIRDQSLKAADAWTSLTEGNRDAWKQYYDPSKYSAQAQQAQASTASFRDFDPASLVDKTTVNPAVLAQGNYTVQGERLRDFDPTLQTSDQREATTRALGMMEDRATGKAPSVAELSYMQNLDKLINTQQGAMSSQRGASNPLAMRSIAQQSAQMGQQAIRETAALRAEEQRQAELNMAQQANTIVAEDQKRVATQKQMELENNIAYTNVLLQNAKNTLEKDIFNADAQNKVSQLQASLDSQMKEFNANATNVRNIENTRLDNQMRIENARNLTDVSKVNAQLGTEVSVQNASNALKGDLWAGDQAQTALINQLAQERSDTLARYGISRDALGTEMEILNQLANQELGLGSAQKGWDYQKQQSERQEDMDWWTKFGMTAKATGDMLATASEFL